MADPVFIFEGSETIHINNTKLDQTVKLIPADPGNRRQLPSYGELLSVLEDAGIDGEKIEGLFKVSDSDSSYSLQMKDEEAVQELMDIQQLRFGKASLNVMKMSEQVVTLRVHWLPLYYDHSILRTVFSLYGQILDIGMMRASHEKVTVLNGVRQVTLKVDEVMKQRIPHLIKFPSGQCCLVTMQGRPPYCLKCQEVGHIRSRCPTNNRSFAGLFKNNRTSAGAGAPPKAPVPQVGAGTGSKDPDPAPSSADAEAVPADRVAASNDATAVSAGGADVSVGMEADEAGSGQRPKSMFDTTDDEENDEDVEMNEKRSKRCRDSSADDDYLTPNKTAKAVDWTEEPPSIELSNPYDNLGVDDLMSSK